VAFVVGKGDGDGDKGYGDMEMGKCPCFTISRIDMIGLSKMPLLSRFGVYFRMGIWVISGAKSSDTGDWEGG
jgi:hypothetical protein